MTLEFTVHNYFFFYSFQFSEIPEFIVKYMYSVHVHVLFYSIVVLKYFFLEKLMEN